MNRSDDLRYTLLLLLLATLATWPVFVFGLPDWGNDAMHHSIETKEFAKQFWNGEIYPRWLKDFNGGLGSPSFFFVPTFSRFAVVWLEPLIGRWDPNGFYITGFGAWLSFVLAGWTTYLWCRTFAQPAGSFVGAALFTVLPYHLVVNLYTRGAMGEMWANVWPPLILFAQMKMMKGARFAFPLLAFSYGCLVMNHLPTTLGFSIVPIIAGWLLSPVELRFKVTFQTIIAMILGVSMAGGYLGPAMMDQQKAYLELMIEGMFQYDKLWLFRWDSILQSQMRLMLLTIATLIPMLLLLWTLLKRVPEPNTRRQVYLLAFMLLYGIFMSSQLSWPLYLLFKPLQMLQFPTRFLQIFVVPVAGITALAWPLLKSVKGDAVIQLGRLSLLGLASITLLATVWGGANAYSAWRPFDAERQANWRLWMDMRPEIYQYLPRTTPMREIDTPQKLGLFLEKHPARQFHYYDLAGEEQAAPRLVEWKPRQILLDVNTEKEGRLVINHFYYPHWHGVRKDTNETVECHPNQDGLIEMSLRPGKYRLQLTLVEMGPEWWGESISLAAFGILGCSVLFALRKA